MENSKIEIKCPRCGRIYSVFPKAYNRKRNDHVYGMLCKSCRAKAQWENMTEEQKSEFERKRLEGIRNHVITDECRKKISEKSKSYWSNLSNKERNQISIQRSKNQKRYISLLSDIDRANIGKKISATKLSKKTAMTEEERIDEFNKRSQISKEVWKNLDEAKKQKIIDQLIRNNEKYWDNITDEERSKRSRFMTERNKEFWRNATDKQKTYIHMMMSRGHKEFFDNMSDEEKTRWKEQSSINSKQFWDNISDDELLRISNMHKNHMSSLSEDEKKEISKRISDVWNSKTDEEKNEIIQKRLATWSSKSPEEIESINDKRSSSLRSMDPDIRKKLSDTLRQYHTAWWNSLSADERERRADILRNSYNNLSEERKNDVKEKQRQRYYSLTDDQKRSITDRVRSYWDALSQEDMSKLMQRIHSKSNGNNSLHQRFQKAFSESYASNDFYLVHEHLTGNEMEFHSWDYGVFNKDTDELIMVVDLDGAYFHADQCDYDGIHSKEEYDEKRSLSVPSGIKIGVIQELNFSKSFELIIKQLMINYDEFIDQLFASCRSSPFPYPCYTDKELLKSYESLRKMDCNDKYHQDISLNTRLGDRLIQHFHHSIWHAHIKGKPSPYEAWRNDELLKKVIENRVIYQSHLNPNKILQGFNVSKIATKVSVFSAGRAKMIISRYLSEYDAIFDPFSGFSGRMLGTISLGKRYVGQDVSLNHVSESNRMIEFLRKYQIGFSASIVQQDILQSSGTYPCLFTCPPYGDKEIWKDGEGLITKSCDEWIDVCLDKFKCQRYVFVVDSTEKYKDNIMDIISNKSHFGKNEEYVICI